MSQSSHGSSPSVRCNCGIPVVTATSWKESNPGRRFIGCEIYPNEGHCKFFRWIDPPICDRAKQIIPGLLRRLNEVREQNADLERRYAQLDEMVGILDSIKGSLAEDNKLLLLQNMELMEENMVLKSVNKKLMGEKNYIMKKMPNILKKIVIGLCIFWCLVKLGNLCFGNGASMKVIA